MKFYSFQLRSNYLTVEAGGTNEPVHGEDLLDLLGAELLEVLLGLDLGEVDEALVGETPGAGGDRAGGLEREREKNQDE